MATKKSSDQTFYRQEEQDVAYLKQQSTIGSRELDDKFDDLFKEKGNMKLIQDEQWEDLSDPSVRRSYRYTSYSSDGKRRTSWCSRWTVVLVLLLAAALTAGVYFYIKEDEI